MAAASGGAGQTFAERAAALFAGLGDKDVAWRLEPEQGFRPGSGDDDAQGSSEDEEGEALQPALAGAASDEECDEEVEQYQLRASCAYRRAFEREADCDAWDEQAAGAMDEPRPLRSMEVLDGNAFDRMHERLRGTRAGSTDGERSVCSLAATCRTRTVTSGCGTAETAGAAAAAEATASRAGGEDAMDLDEELPPPQAVDADALQRQPIESALRQRQQQQQHPPGAGRPPAKRQRPGFGEPWLPPHRRDDDRCAYAAVLWACAVRCASDTWCLL